MVSGPVIFGLRWVPVAVLGLREDKKLEKGDGALQRFRDDLEGITPTLTLATVPLPRSRYQTADLRIQLPSGMGVSLLTPIGQELPEPIITRFSRRRIIFRILNVVSNPIAR